MNTTPPPRIVTTIGGGHAFTLTAWLTILPFALTVIGGYSNATTRPERIAGVIIALCAHVAFGAGMFVGAFWERRLVGAWPRFWLVIGLSSALGALRPIVLLAASDALDLQLFAGSLAHRIATNVFSSVVIICMISILVTGLRRRIEARQQLLAVSEKLESQERRNSIKLADLEAEFLDPALTIVRSALQSLPEPATFDSDVEAARLTRIASEIVRPLSHELFAQGPDEPNELPPAVSHSPDVDPTSTPVQSIDAQNDGHTRSVTAPRLFEGLHIAPATIWAPTLLYLALIFPYVSGQDEAGQRLIALGFGLVVSIAGNTIVAMVVPSLPALPASIILVASYMLVAAASDVTSTMFGPDSMNGYSVSLVTLFCYPAVAVSVSACQSILQHLADIEGTLATALRDQEHSAAALRQRLFAARQSAARLLHSGVQGELSAIALRLRAGKASKADVAAALDTIDNLFAPGMTTSPPSETMVADQIHQLLNAWRNAMPIDCDADPTAWTRLAEDPARTELAVDTISEALSNVIRHASTARATIAFTATPEASTGVTVTVRSPGILRVTEEGDGYGIADLRRRALAATLRQDGTEVELSVTIA